MLCQGLIVCPTSNLDVSAAVTLATKHKVPLTTCGGAHARTVIRARTVLTASQGATRPAAKPRATAASSSTCAA